jgi:signal transduction histidine kinase
MPVIASDARIARWVARERAPGSRRRWVPRWTVRLRLTVLYGVLFLIAGAALLGITYGLVAGDGDLTAKHQFVIEQSDGNPVVNYRRVPSNLVFKPAPGAVRSAKQVLPLPPGLRGPARRLQAAANLQVKRQHAAQLSALLTRSGIALAIMALASMGLGWLMAGRVLRPLRTMNSRVRLISEHNLHERLAVGGHDDELRELGDAFDGLLGRLEGAFESQRRFVANASHELRTPVTLERALLEVALADPGADVESLRAACARVLKSGEQQERTINALLTLARSERGLETRESFDLRDVASEALAGGDIGAARIETALERAPASGDAALTERLMTNLVENAVRHNDERGWVRVVTGDRSGFSVLTVSNTGPVISPAEVATMHEPFSRLNGQRTGHGDGVGLGLSIVDAIARAHGASVRTEPRSDGGLDVEVAFPPEDWPVLVRLYTA